MCDFAENPDPIAFAAGIFRCRDRPGLRRHVRFPGKSGPYRFRDWDILMSGPPELPAGMRFFETTRIAPLSQIAKPYRVIALRERIEKCENAETLAKWSKLAHSAIAIAFFCVTAALVSNKNNAERKNRCGSGRENGWN